MPVDGSAVGTLFRVHKSFLPPTRAPSAHTTLARAIVRALAQQQSG